MHANKRLGGVVGRPPTIYNQSVYIKGIWNAEVGTKISSVRAVPVIAPWDGSHKGTRNDNVKLLL